LSFFIHSRRQKNPKAKPARIPPQTLPPRGKLAEVLRKSKSPENSFRKTESALKPRHTARILGGQNPKKKNVLSILEKNGRAQIRKARNIFLWGCRAERGSGGAFVIQEFLIK